MLTAALYGLGTALPLLVGAMVGLRYDLPRQLLAALMAFGAGTMVAAVSTELFQPAFESEGVLVAGVALMLGALVYVVADHLIENRLGPAALGWALMLGTLLDGVPENTALGVSLGVESGFVLLVAIAVGNMPEAVAGAASMRKQHNFDRRRAMLLWTVTAVLLVLVVIGAYAASDAISDRQVAIVQAFAGGATIAVLADSLMPEAYREGGWWVGLSTALGFLTAFALGG
ncbi:MULTISPECIES: ZIP family metal transporter [Rhodococcus]|uniref:ZIP family metal transporter n=1 Tax=Rhodococcus TaxID=1827 RepID=UPI001AEA6E97|nr:MULTISPECIES: ZIP family metal transporter [Rhodococcus]MBP1160829.1 ZIP family zinc transporter [Rhodococcus sp. PvR099]MCZ4557298.1 ZIP family metal transporter [Rhodococcus maanshanensis]